MSAITEAQAKILIISRLRQSMEAMAVSERTRPRYMIDMKSYTVLDLIREVEAWSTVGKSYVFSEAKNLGYVVT